MKVIAVPLAEGFEEIEAITIIDVLRRAGFKVLTAGLKGTLVKGAHDVVVEADCRLADLRADQLDAVVLPGGLPGATNLRDDPALLKLVQDVDRRQRHVAAICAAPIALQAAGLLKGKNVTSYPGFESQLVGARHTGARVQVDGRLITGAGPGTALEFALALVAELGAKAKADELRQGMLAR